MHESEQFDYLRYLGCTLNKLIQDMLLNMEIV